MNSSLAPAKIIDKQIISPWEIPNSCKSLVFDVRRVGGVLLIRFLPLYMYIYIYIYINIYIYIYIYVCIFYVNMSLPIFDFRFSCLQCYFGFSTGQTKRNKAKNNQYEKRRYRPAREIENKCKTRKSEIEHRKLHIHIK